MSARNNPFEELERYFERMSSQFEDVSQRWESESPISRWGSELEPMAIDLAEHDDEFVASVDLPGFEHDDVDITVTDHTLRIRADREESAAEEEKQYIRQERRHEATSRSIRLPDEVDTEHVTATMKHGVLTVTLPKIESEEPRNVDIEIE